MAALRNGRSAHACDSSGCDGDVFRSARRARGDRRDRRAARRSRSTGSSCTTRSCSRGSNRGDSRSQDEAQRAKSLPETPAVLITAHGISDRERQRLESAGKRLVDTTCPLVTRVHQAARRSQAEGYHVLVIGRRGHVEVEGITEDLDHFDVIESADEVTVYPSPRLGIVCQTTATDRTRRVDPRARSPRRTRTPRSSSSTRSACRPRSTSALSSGCSSGSTRSWSSAGATRTTRASWLLVAARAASPPFTCSRPPTSIRPGSRDFATVGLTAGTSTLAETIDEVHRALVWIGRLAVSR